MFVYFGYPIFLVLISIFSKKNKTDESYYPNISLIIPIYNEELIIGEKIKNNLSLDYPKDKLEIIVVSDGSTDGSKSIVEKYLDKGIKFFEFERAGKLVAINRVFPYTKGEIIVFTDANPMFNESALKKLTRHFVDVSIGAVTGVEKIKKGGNV